MKTKLLFACLILSAIVNAQIIDFQDLDFKNTLLESKINFNDQFSVILIDYPFIDSNSDGEITQQEALLVNRLDLAYTEINNLTGLEYFVNLKSFNSLFFAANQFYFPTLDDLENLVISNAVTGMSAITTLDLSPNTSLKNVNIITIATSVNLSNLTELKNLSINGNFTQIDLTDCENLLSLSLDAPLETLNFNENNKLISMYIRNTDFTSLDLSSCTNLEIVEVTNTEMEEIDLGEIQHVYYLILVNNKLTSLNASNLFNLKILGLDNNLLTNISVKNGIIEEQITISGNPNLTTICCDANEIVYIQNICNNLDYSIAISDCEFALGSKVSIAMYPNPVSDVLHLDSNKKISKIEIFSISGLLVMNDNTESTSINLNLLQAGVYFIKVYSGNDIVNMKFIKN